MKWKLCLLSIFGMLIFFAANVNAEVKAGSFTVSPNLGYNYWPDEYSPWKYIDNNMTYGLSLGYDFTERFGIEASYNTLDTEVMPGGVVQVSGGGGGGPPPPPGAPPPPPAETIILAEGGSDVSSYLARIEGLFYFYPFGDKFTPYATFGIGSYEYQYGGFKFHKMNLPIGFGFKYFITDKLAIRADYRFIMPIHKNNDILSVGLTYRFGGE